MLKEGPVFNLFCVPSGKDFQLEKKNKIKPFSSPFPNLFYKRNQDYKKKRVETEPARVFMSGCLIDKDFIYLFFPEKSGRVFFYLLLFSKR